MAARVTRLLVAAVVLCLLTACGPESRTAPRSAPTTPSAPVTSAEPSGHAHPSGPAPKPVALRPGEHRMTLTMPESYTPSAPTGFGTDDYRCFLLDPHLRKPAYLTGTNVLPGNPTVVHHVILFRAEPSQIAEAKAKDASEPGEGWTCFGSTGLSGDFGNIDDANWLGAWAPGGGESIIRKGYGTKLVPGTQIIMQVHYNLLAAKDGQGEPDTSSTQLRLRSGNADLTPIHTILEPAPVELPCRVGHASSPLCDRDNAVADVKARFGDGPGATGDVLYFLCGGTPQPSEITSCTRPIQQPLTILGVAGHMHLLGRWIKIQVNPGTPQARTILDIKPWDFDNQGARPIKPVHLDTFDTVKVTCKHVQWLRDQLPAFESQRQDRYVVWGEGTTDEMCLGILQVAFDSERP